MNRERIENVAIQHDGGIYILPPPFRHSDVAITMQRDGVPLSGSVQGFWTSEGRFVDRVEAYRIAFAAGQLLHREEMTPEILYSEDLW